MSTMVQAERWNFQIFYSAAPNPPDFATAIFASASWLPGANQCQARHLPTTYSNRARCPSASTWKNCARLLLRPSFGLVSAQQSVCTFLKRSFVASKLPSRRRSATSESSKRRRRSEKQTVQIRRKKCWKSSRQSALPLRCGTSIQT